MSERSLHIAHHHVVISLFGLRISSYFLWMTVGHTELTLFCDTMLIIQFTSSKLSTVPIWKELRSTWMIWTPSSSLCHCELLVKISFILLGCSYVYIHMVHRIFKRTKCLAIANCNRANSYEGMKLQSCALLLWLAVLLITFLHPACALMANQTNL